MIFELHPADGESDMKRNWIFALVAVLAMGLGAGSALAAGDAANGEKVFKKCKTCHALEPGKNKVGPSLAGIFGRKAAEIDGYKYSGDLVAAGEKGLVWDDATMDEYLTDPKAFLRAYLGDDSAKGKMKLKLSKEAQRADVIAYLRANGQ